MSQEANKIFRWEQAKCLKYGKTGAIKSRLVLVLYLIGWKCFASFHINLNYFHIISISITCNIQVKVDLYTKTIQYKSSSFFLRWQDAVLMDKNVCIARKYVTLYWSILCILEPLYRKAIFITFSCVSLFA